MELNIVNNEKDFLEFYIDERHTFCALLRGALLEDSKVVFAAYKLDHIFDKKAKFAVRTKGKTPIKALEDALSLMEKNLSSYEKTMLKSLA